MTWRGIGSDPATDAAAVDVIAAFEAAQEAGLPTVRCYLAGVEAWRRAHPDQRLEYAARQAVAVIHAGQGLAARGGCLSAAALKRPSA